MFYNALKRKGKANGITEDDMGMLLAIHNGTNERAWKMVMEWEKDFKECADPTLLKFQGKPHDLSPKARFKTLFMGYPMPFDRHDWTVDRCGKEVRYVLDFYYDETDEDKNMDIAKRNTTIDNKMLLWVILSIYHGMVTLLSLVPFSNRALRFLPYAKELVIVVLIWVQLSSVFSRIVFESVISKILVKLCSMVPGGFTVEQTDAKTSTVFSVLKMMYLVNDTQLEFLQALFQDSQVKRVTPPAAPRLTSTEPSRSPEAGKAVPATESRAVAT